MIVVASIFVVRYALEIQADPTKSLVYGDDFSHLTIDAKEVENHPFGIREKLVLATLAAGIAVIVWGVKVKGWYFEDLSAVFLIMGIVSSLSWDGDQIPSLKRWQQALLISQSPV